MEVHCHLKFVRQHPVRKSFIKLQLTLFILDTIISSKLITQKVLEKEAQLNLFHRRSYLVKQIIKNFCNPPCKMILYQYLAKVESRIYLLRKDVGNSPKNLLLHNSATESHVQYNQS
jgi:hypothetical protein